jgi:hypothetical protein
MYKWLFDLEEQADMCVELGRELHVDDALMARVHRMLFFSSLEAYIDASCTAKAIRAHRRAEARFFAKSSHPQSTKTHVACALRAWRLDAKRVMGRHYLFLWAGRRAPDGADLSLNKRQVRRALCVCALSYAFCPSLS